jgi:hypothetical protein
MIKHKFIKERYNETEKVIKAGGDRNAPLKTLDEVRQILLNRLQNLNMIYIQFPKLV